MTTDRYGSIQDERDAYNVLSEDEAAAEEIHAQNDGLMRDVPADEDDDEYDDDDDDEYGIQELLYSSSSYYAIAKPVTISMVMAALAVQLVNNDLTISQGEAAMASAYQVWSIDGASSDSSAFFMSLGNAFVMVSVICLMTFLIVLLYRLQCMKCLIGYMMLCSGTLLGMLGGNLVQTAISIYNIPIDKFTFYGTMYNFAFVGVMAIFWGKGIPKSVTQGYLIATSVILAWHLNYFDPLTTWSLLFMLALYDLCAVLTPCGPLKALVNLMSKDDAPEMPGLLYEAELPPEARRPRSATRNSNNNNNNNRTQETSPSPPAATGPNNNNRTNLEVKIPLAIAKVYQLTIVSVPSESRKVMDTNRSDQSNISSSPLLTESTESDEIHIPENPTPVQLKAEVVVRLPSNGGSIEPVSRRGKKVYMERDRHGQPKRILWVDHRGKVFAEMKEDDEENPDHHNSIRLGLGDFIFYSVLVAKAAQYSFATFAACTLVILAGLGGTLVLLSVYGHALPALPISIFLGIISYITTRFLVEPYIEAVMAKPFYV